MASDRETFVIVGDSVRKAVRGDRFEPLHEHEYAKLQAYLESTYPHALADAAKGDSAVDTAIMLLSRFKRFAAVTDTKPENDYPDP